MPRSRRGRPSGPAVAAALAAALAGGCRGPGGPELGRRVVLESPADGPARIDPAFAPAFDALRAAVEDGEDDVARRILASIYARDPRPELLEFARTYERILDGRQLVGDLRLALAVEAVDGAPADRRLVLVASHPREAEVVLRLPAGTLRRARTAIDPRGDESRSLTTQAVDALDGLRVPPGAEVRVPLVSFVIETGGALAVRERWSLETRSGAIAIGDVELPAREPDVAPCEALRLAPFLPSAAVEPAELARYLGADQDLYLPALLERAVRVDPARRAEALDLLGPVVAELVAARPERLAEAAPALRWLARSADVGRDPEAWAAWFAARGEARRPERDPAALDLPEDLRGR